MEQSIGFSGALFKKDFSRGKEYMICVQKLYENMTKYLVWTPEEGLDITYLTTKNKDLEKSTKFLGCALCPRYLPIVSEPNKYNLSPVSWPGDWPRGDNQQMSR